MNVVDRIVEQSSRATTATDKYRVVLNFSDVLIYYWYLNGYKLQYQHKKEKLPTDFS